MFSTSKDLLFIIISFCILWLTAFTCWAIYYIAMILKGVKNKSDKVDEILGKADETINSIKSKIERPSAFVPLLMEGIREAMSFIRNYQEKKARREEKENKES